MSALKPLLVIHSHSCDATLSPCFSAKGKWNVPTCIPKQTRVLFPERAVHYGGVHGFVLSRGCEEGVAPGVCASMVSDLQSTVGWLRLQVLASCVQEA